MSPSKRSLMAFALLCAWLAPGPSQAATAVTPAAPATEAMVQVSDRFRVVAKRVLTKLVFARLKAGCHGNHRCEALVGALEELVPAVAAKDNDALALAIGRFITRYSFYVGIESAAITLPLDALGTTAPCKAAAQKIGQELMSCVPELYLGHATACSADVVSGLVKACADEPIVATVRRSAQAGGWDLAKGPRNADDWILLAIDVEQKVYERGLSTPLANFALTTLHELTRSTRSYFDHGMAVRDNLNRRLAGAMGAAPTMLFPADAIVSRVSGAVATCAPDFAPALADWTTQRAGFAEGLRKRQAPGETALAPLRKLRTLVPKAGCSDVDALILQALRGASDEALLAPRYAEMEEVAPLFGLVLDLVNGRDATFVRKAALRWLIVAGYDRFTASAEAPTCEAAAARLLAGEVATLATDGCLLGDAKATDLPAGLFTETTGHHAVASKLLAALGNGQYVLADPGHIDLAAAAQLLVRAARQAGVPDQALEPALLMARGDFEAAAARVVSDGGARLLAAVRARLDGDADKVKDHYAIVATVVEAAYTPLSELFAGGDRQVILSTLANRALKGAIEDEALNRTPVLVRAGLGATWSHFRGESSKVNLTVLDQFGLAWKFGGACDPYVGAFAGGFIDAFVRSQQDGTSRNFWVAGATVGVTRFSATVPLGLELHGGGALPFADIGNGPRGWMWGFSLLVPIDMVLDD